MAKKRANGEGSIRKRSDGRWEGRYTAGYDQTGKRITKNVLVKTQAEVKEKLAKARALPRLWRVGSSPAAVHRPRPNSWALPKPRL